MRKVLIPGLVFYGLLSGMGLFLGSGPSSPFFIPWLAGYLFLVFTLSYFSLFSKNQFNSFPFIILGIIGLNFFVQVTGGVVHEFGPRISNPPRSSETASAVMSIAVVLPSGTTRVRVRR